MTKPLVLLTCPRGCKEWTDPWTGHEGEKCWSCDQRGMRVEDAA